MSFNLFSKDIKSRFVGLTRDAQPVFSRLMNVLFFNPSDERLYPDKVIAFSLGQGVIGATLVSRWFGKIRLIASQQYPLSHDKIATATELLKIVLSAMSDFKYQTKDIVLTIPSQWVVFKTATFPISVKDNIKNVITYELDRLTPFNSDDANFDYSIINEDESSIGVAVLSTKLSMIKPYIEELKMSDINVQCITSNNLANVSLLNYLDNKKDKVVINLSESSISTYLISSSKIIDYKKSILDYTDESTLTDTLVGEIKASMNGVGNKNDVAVYLTGQLPKSNLIETVRLKTTSQLTTLTDAVKKRKINLLDESLISAFGASINYLIPSVSGFNLLTNGVKNKQKRPLVISAILVVILLMLVTAYFVMPLKTEEKNLEKISAIINSKKEDIKRAETLKKSIESLQSEIDSIDSFTNDGMATLDIMKELTTVIPTNTWLTRIRITPKTVEIEGFAENTAGLLTKLEESRFFMNVEFSAPSYRDHSTKMERFTIKMQREDKHDKEKK